MKIVFAFDSFKDSLDAISVGHIAQQAWQRVFPDSTVVNLPMADGGEGTMQALVQAKGGYTRQVIVKDPLMRHITASYGLIDYGKTAVIEMAQASGLPLLTQKERNPMYTSTFGTGQLINDALAQGVHKILLTIGGSATNDGGAGMLEALGVEFFDEHRQILHPNGSNLADIQEIQINQSLLNMLHKIDIIIACDVNNPLIGRNGASVIFGPQKGATPEMINKLDKNLLHYGSLLEKITQKSLINLPGSGAAGGLAISLLAFSKATLCAGVEMVAKELNLEESIRTASLVISGEGRIDGQSTQGKTPMGVARLAQKHTIPCILVVGSVGTGYEKIYHEGVDAIFPIIGEVKPLEQTLLSAEENLTRTILNIAWLYKLAKGVDR